MKKKGKRIVTYVMLAVRLTIFLPSENLLAEELKNTFMVKRSKSFPIRLYFKYLAKSARDKLFLADFIGYR